MILIFQYAANLLEYLRRRKFGFQLLCNALRYTSQDFLADMLIKTTESIPEVGMSEVLFMLCFAIKLVNIFHFIKF